MFVDLLEDRYGRASLYFLIVSKGVGAVWPWDDSLFGSGCPDWGILLRLQGVVKVQALEPLPGGQGQEAAKQCRHYSCFHGDSCAV